MKEEYMNVTEAAEYLGVSRSTVYRWSKKGLIPIYIVAGSKPRVKFADVKKLYDEAQLLYPQEDK